MAARTCRGGRNGERASFDATRGWLLLALRAADTLSSAARSASKGHPLPARTVRGQRVVRRTGDYFAVQQVSTFFAASQQGAPTSQHSSPAAQQFLAAVLPKQHGRRRRNSPVPERSNLPSSSTRLADCSSLRRENNNCSWPRPARRSSSSVPHGHRPRTAPKRRPPRQPPQKPLTWSTCEFSSSHGMNEITHAGDGAHHPRLHIVGGRLEEINRSKRREEREAVEVVRSGIPPN